MNNPYFPFQPREIPHKCPSCDAPLRSGGGQVGQDLIPRFRVGCIICGFKTDRIFEPEKLQDIHALKGIAAVEAEIASGIKAAHDEQIYRRIENGEHPLEILGEQAPPG